jgi:DNA polymerase-2
MTVHGPEPAQQRQSPLDYAHYLDRQLAPVADTILHFVGTSFDQITNPQMELF